MFHGSVDDSILQCFFHDCIVAFFILDYYVYILLLLLLLFFFFFFFFLLLFSRLYDVSTCSCAK